MSTAATIPAPTAVYREEQFFAWWVYLLMAIMVGVACAFLSHRNEAEPALRHAVDWGVGVGLALPGFLILGVLRMTTQVTTTRVEVSFGWVPTYRRALDASGVRAIEVVTYRPLKDCGGWGIRSGPGGERVLNARGDRGVRLHLADGSRLLIGSQSPEALAAAIERAMNPAG